MKNTYYRRMKSLDREMANSLKSIYTSFNICQDRNNAHLTAFNETYKLICPADPAKQIPSFANMVATTTTSTAQVPATVVPASNTTKPSTSILPTSTSQPSPIDLFNANQVKVFKAIDVIQAKLVVVKLYPPLLNMAENLRHPALIPIREIVYTDQYTFVIMDTMQCTLRQALNENPVLYDRTKTATLVYTVC